MNQYAYHELRYALFSQISQKFRRKTTDSNRKYLQKQNESSKIGSDTDEINWTIADGDKTETNLKLAKCHRQFSRQNILENEQKWFGLTSFRLGFI